ncbi:30S ribosome-binding factor RbfA [Rubellicoccus peritrichatus]|uniref:Ribosome-binding factor A n=1 Tax=Rubellicoccus peritrichatus TaxID=3080537 RepID=A0AAQ3QTZ8_9BACT|nr:30S ribosome-binding factor RbfA [Puniceicoccus sp. CR14]WOO39465.1 30S ribosome-binding factor RbfA [Puniceicoccus sp. CR14]
MSRIIRVNELLKREISQIIHTDYREQSAAITITDVDVAPDLRTARVYYSVLGDESAGQIAEKLFSSKKKDIRHKISKVIVLKYLPHLKFYRDNSIERGNRVVDLLEELDEEERK